MKTLALLGAFAWALGTGPQVLAANPADHYASMVKGGQTSAPFLAAITMPGTYSSATASSQASLEVSTSGATTSLLSGTPFADSYGPSTGYQYLSLSGRTVTTITFASTMPARSLGINLGDIDAEEVQVTMSGPSGVLTAAQMGFQSTYNYARSAARPGVTEAGTTVTLRDEACVTGGCDTSGASAWFQVQSEVTTITFTATAITGFPRYQLWLAAGAGQTVTWTPTNTTVNLSALPLTPNTLATTTGNGTLSYVIDDPGSTGCSVDATTAVIHASAGGVCVVAAVASETLSYLAGEELVSFTIIDDIPDPPQEEGDRDNGDEADAEGIVALPTATPATLAPTGASLTGLAVSLGLAATGLGVIAFVRERSGVKRR